MRSTAIRSSRASPGNDREALREAFAAEVERLSDRLFGTALRFTRNVEDAEDLVAETVAKAWAELDELREPRAFERWIQRILANTFVSDWRHRRASPIVDAEPREQDEGEAFSLYERLHQPFLLWWSNPEEATVQKLLREDMDRAVDALPDALRVAVILVDVQGHAYGEAADILGVPVGTIRSRLARGRAQLQRELWQHGRDAGLVSKGGDS